MTHECPGGCGRQVADHMLACGYHWKQVTPRTQAEVYRTWRKRTSPGSTREDVAAHQRAMAAAIREMRPQAAS